MKAAVVVANEDVQYLTKMYSTWIMRSRPRDREKSK